MSTRGLVILTVIPLWISAAVYMHGTEQDIQMLAFCWLMYIVGVAILWKGR